MTGWVVIDLVGGPPPDESLTGALVASCSAATGTSGCVLGTGQEVLTPGDVRARVFVSFSPGYATIRIETVAPLRGGLATQSERELTFREGDPQIERFRAAGLVVAELVAGTQRPTDDVATGPGAPPPVPDHRDAPLWSFAWTLGPASVRPRLGAWFSIDVPLGASPAFVTASALYEQSWHPDANGISEQHAALCAGTGFAVPLIPRALDFRGRVEIEVEDLRASVRQPMTGREDAGGHVVAGLGAHAEVIWPMSARIGLLVGGRLGWLGSDTTVRVQDQPVSAIPAVEGSVMLGLNARIP
jgi:hypothetical protein